MQALRDDPALRFELCIGVSGVDYPHETGRELHAVYHLMSMTHNRRVRLEVVGARRRPAHPVDRLGLPDGRLARAGDLRLLRHRLRRPPGLTRILMPDDWPGHPQRKDYPLGGIPVEYKGAADPAAGRAEGVRVTDTDATRPTRRTRHAPRDHRGHGLHRHRRGLGRRRRRASARPPRSGSSSTWARSTRRRTACSGWSSSSRARRSPRPARHRLPAHRHREELRVPHLDPGRHVRDAHGLPGAAVQRDAYCLGVERLLGIEDQIPERANVIRVMMMELNRISSHLVALATGGMELGALTR